MSNWGSGDQKKYYDFTKDLVDAQKKNLKNVKDANKYNDRLERFRYIYKILAIVATVMLIISFILVWILYAYNDNKSDKFNSITYATVSFIATVVVILGSYISIKHYYEKTYKFKDNSKNLVQVLQKHADEIQNGLKEEIRKLKDKVNSLSTSNAKEKAEKEEILNAYKQIENNKTYLERQLGAGESRQQENSFDPQGWRNISTDVNVDDMDDLFYEGQG